MQHICIDVFLSSGARQKCNHVTQFQTVIPYALIIETQTGQHTYMCVNMHMIKVETLEATCTSTESL